MSVRADDADDPARRVGLVKRPAREMQSAGARSRQPAAGSRLFAYGSLQLPEVFLAVTGTLRPSRRAILSDYGRYRLRDRSYPGIRHEPGASTEGRLYSGLGPAIWRRLDRFEDDFYVRRRLPVTLVGEGTVMAEVYVVPVAASSLLLPEPWDLEEFRRAGLAAMLRSLAAGTRRSPRRQSEWV